MKAGDADPIRVELSFIDFQLGSLPNKQATWLGVAWPVPECNKSTRHHQLADSTCSAR